jgi:hypothetical protein
MTATGIQAFNNILRVTEYEHQNITTKAHDET